MTWHEDVFQMLKSRLDKPYSRFDGTCNPGSPLHWFKKFLESDADIYQQEYCLDDNLFLSPVFAENLKREYAGTVYYDRYVLGKWALADGLIYPMFSNRHITKVQPKGGKYYISVDYGTYNPFSAGLWCVSDGKAYRISEYYYSGRESQKPQTDEEYYNRLERLAEDHWIECVIIDPSASSFIETIKRHQRFRVKRADNDVLVGIRRVASLLNSDRILISDRCQSCIREFGLYSWDTNTPEDSPVKENDHAMDETRYFVSTILRREFKWVD